MNFIDTLDNSPTDLIGSKYGVVVFAAKDFDDWCESLAIAHDDEVYIASNAYLEDIPDERLTKNGLVRLPVDADGVPIHVGDVMEWPYGNGEFIVEGIGRDVLFYIDQDSNECEWTAVRNKCHHHHESTVEEVMQEMLEQAVGYSDAHTTVALNAIAEYAAKLRLRGDAE